MAERLHLRPKHRQVLEALLQEHLPGVEVWACGSRVSRRSHDGSDLDLVLRGPDLKEIPIGRLGDFEEAVRESTIPFLVEARDWTRLPKRFHREIERRHVVLVAGDSGRLEGKRSSVGNKWSTDRFERLLSEPVRNGIYKRKEFHGRGAKIVNMGELFAHPRLRAVPMKRVELSESEANRFLIAVGDLLFARRSLVAEGAGKCCAVLNVDEPTAFESSIIRARPDTTKADYLYLYYFFNSALGLYHLDTIRRQVAVAGITGSDLAKLEIPVPPLPEQRAIAHILGTLDDKIELNRRMNETLEAMARALFKSWFVDFDPVRAKMAGRDPGLPQPLADLFPDRLVNSELGEIPEGWEVKQIEDIAERVAMGPFGSSIKVATFVEAGIPVISGQHLNGTLLDDNEYRFITKEHAERLAKANVQRGDVIFTHAGSIGQVAYIPQTSQFERYVVSQRQFYMRCDVNQVSPLFVVHFFKTTEGQHQLLANTSSTGVPSISRPVTYLRSIRLCIPPRELWRRFDKFVERLHLKAARNTAESNILTALRDALLPKLVSGQIRLRNAERFAKVAP